MIDHILEIQKAEVVDKIAMFLSEMRRSREDWGDEGDRGHAQVIAFEVKVGCDGTIQTYDVKTSKDHTYTGTLDVKILHRLQTFLEFIEYFYHPNFWTHLDRDVRITKAFCLLEALLRVEEHKFDRPPVHLRILLSQSAEARLYAIDHMFELELEKDISHLSQFPEGTQVTEGEPLLMTSRGLIKISEAERQTDTEDVDAFISEIETMLAETNESASEADEGWLPKALPTG